ncbi:hypothetical protein Tco_1421284 [Tanacetum coccineum]
MAEVKDVNEDGYETDGDNEEPILETTQNLKRETSTPSKDVESSMAENVVKVELVKVNATPPQGKCGIGDVDKDKGALSVTLRNSVVHFVVGACENMISGTRMRPGDIVPEFNELLKIAVRCLKERPLMFKYCAEEVTRQMIAEAKASPDNQQKMQKLKDMI